MTRATERPTVDSKKMVNGVAAPGRASIPARTLRTDNWRKAPVVTFILLSSWVLYATLRTVWQAAYFDKADHYLSPFYSPCVTASCTDGSRDFGTWFGHFPIIIPFAIVTLPFLLGFRLTCYYYRRSYYRAFWASPPACAVAEPHGSYSGETKFPLILQNLHRYFWVAAGIISIVNTWDVVQAFRPEGHAFGFGLGTIIMLINVVMLWAYTLSCHSCRHIVGGKLRNFSRHPMRYKAWTMVSKLNAKHMQLAWTTLATLAVTDAYIAFVAAGVFSDPRILH
ncbi:hypothetical protein [Jatrophihabitans endophyticus]|uniref:hypothetical protein n=1 Tax=Jatrophihabitans endophyticus TaxID=1206085 RepID=UPI0026F1E881|nr:hypothetical protein [Jatrophihabitans endophyticus]